MMVWGGISVDDRTDLVVVRGNLAAAGYVEQILLQHVLVTAYVVGPEFVLKHHNACSAHRQSCLARTGHSRD